METQFHATTICAVRKNGKTAIAGDGQVTFGEHTIMKANARKVRRLYHDQILAGFAGSTSDALTLFERFEAKLEEFSGNLLKASVELAKDWRKDKYLRRLEAMIMVADTKHILVLSGTGDVIEPDDQIAAIGSGGPYALAAARALAKNTDMDSEAIVREAMGITADICVFTNTSLTIESLPE